jgi:hypothetical protein
MEVKINVPDSLADITVGQYQEWAKLIEGDWSPIREKIITAAIFCKQDIDTIESISISDLNKIYKHLSKVIEGAFSNELKPIIKIGGKSYGFHPRLNEMTTGEWADLEEELQEQGDLFKAMPQILAILYRPIVKVKWWKRKKTYEIEKYSPRHIENADKMKEVDMETASGMALFFWTLGEQSSENFIQSMEADLKNRMN